MSEKDREKKAQEEENQHDGEIAVENIVAGTYETYLIAENGIRQYPNADNIASVDGIVRIFFPPRKQNEETADHIEEKDNQSASRSDSASADDSEGEIDSKKKFTKLVRLLLRNAPAITVICENVHVDPCFRDSYYSFYSGQHFDMPRFTKRLTFFKGDWRDYDKFVKDAQTLNKSFMGTCVIYPTYKRTIGQVLFDPQYLIKEASPVYIRLTDYSFTVLGVRLKLRAFLFQMQNGETTRCAEVTLLNVLDYYGRTYNEYRTYLPSDIIHAERSLIADRPIPARGINYYAMSRILTKYGFTPRLYSFEALNQDITRGKSKSPLKHTTDKARMKVAQEAWKKSDLDLHRLAHYYIESGIPVAINVADRSNYLVPGHSLVCIGYVGRQTEENKSQAMRAAITMPGGGPKLINAADYYSRYVVMDDNQTPYAIRRFDKLSLYSDLNVVHILIPLYKRMHMEAADAYDIVCSLLDNDAYGIISRGGEYGSKDAIVIRLFMASSRTYKNYRILHSDGQSSYYRQLYSSIPFPRFVWVAELFTTHEFEAPKGKAFGEIVLDATATVKSYYNSVIMINYPDVISTRYPDKPIDVLDYKGIFDLKPFPRFEGNHSKFPMDSP